MALIALDIMGNTFIGNYAVSTDEVALVPMGTPRRKMDKIAEAMGVRVYDVSVAASRLIGIFVVANSRGLLLPQIVETEELKVLKEKGLNPTVVKSKWTAWGNLVLANDRGALVDPRLPSEVLRQVSDGLGVEVVRGEVNRSTLIGSRAIATNRAALCDPRVREDEVERISEILRVPVITGTVNNGLQHVRSGVVANSKGAIVGAATTGPELVDLSQLFQ